MIMDKYIRSVSPYPATLHIFFRWRSTMPICASIWRLRRWVYSIYSFTSLVCHSLRIQTAYGSGFPIAWLALLLPPSSEWRWIEWYGSCMLVPKERNRNCLTAALWYCWSSNLHGRILPSTWNWKPWTKPLKGDQEQSLAGAIWVGGC